jgi:y4mF family transcriptional regulator
MLDRWRSANPSWAISARTKVQNPPDREVFRPDVGRQILSSRPGSFGLPGPAFELIFPLGKMITPITTSADFGICLQRARKALGLTQRDLALAVGVGERFIVDLEAGKPTAQLGKALAVAKAAGIHLADIAELVIDTRPGAAP